MSTQTQKHIGQGLIGLGVLATLLPLGLLVYGIILAAPHAQEPTNGVRLIAGFPGRAGRLSL